ncbi:hypothetical protein HZC53_04775 [Candidatus Uhrbacteria bacterium]|nr:hypothetical protein [Candidatus Uhrbacteria bacterium]
MKFHKNPEAMATLFAVGSFVLAILFGTRWAPAWYVFEPSWFLFVMVDRWAVGAEMLAATPSDAQSDILFYIYGPVGLACFLISAGIWAAIGFHVGKYLGKKN